MFEITDCPHADIASRLIEHIATGDRPAFAELYDRMHGRAFAVVLRVLRDPAQAEEVTQDVFLEVWQLAVRFRADKGSGAAWVLGKAHSRAVDRVRSVSAGRTRDMTIGMRALASTESSIAETVELRIESERVSRALETLPDVQREAVRLSHLEGYSHTEVSALLNVPVGTVKTRIRSGLSRLREELTPAA